jgi:beta-glucosidase
MAATFNTELVKKELKFQHMKLASSIPWVFSPDLDLPRNQAWSRMGVFGKMLIYLANGCCYG